MPLILRQTREHYCDQPEPKPAWPDDHYVALSGGLVVGIIRGERSGPGSRAWHWSINGVYNSAPDSRMSGMAPTLAEAKAQFGESWRAWLRWAGLREEPFKDPLTRLVF